MNKNEYLVEGLQTDFPIKLFARKCSSSYILNSRTASNTEYASQSVDLPCVLAVNKNRSSKQLELFAIIYSFSIFNLLSTSVVRSAS